MLKIRKNTRKLFLLAAVLLFTACSKTETVEFPDLKKSYFPLEVGHSITYQVDSTVYDKFDNSKKDYSFQIKDSVITEIESASNSRTVYIERYKRADTDSPWTFQKVISRSVTDLRAEEFIENQRFVRFIFPPEKNRVWNGNTYNNIGKQEYYFKRVDAKETIDNTSFDSTALVVQIDENNLLREDYAEELYARNIGLVYKYVKAIEKDFYTQKIVNGTVYTMRIISSK